MTFFRETPKKGREKFQEKFGPPVSEVLDPLVIGITLLLYLGLELALSECKK